MEVDKSTIDEISIEDLEYIKDVIVSTNEFNNLNDKTQLVDQRLDKGTRTRYTHTFDVANISKMIARGVKPGDQKFELLVEVAALLHDIGHTPYGHEGEDPISKYLQQFPRSAAYNKKRIEDLGLDYIMDLKEEENMIFEHNEHSVRVYKQIAEREGIPFYDVLRHIILYHSTSRTEFPMDLASQIVRVADKISYYVNDIEDLIKEGYVDEKDTVLFGRSAFKIKRAAVEEVIAEYEHTGKIEGGLSEYKKYEYLKDANSPIYESEIIRLEEFFHENFPTLFELCKSNTEKVQKAIYDVQSDLKNDRDTQKIPLILDYYERNPRIN